MAVRFAALGGVGALFAAVVLARWSDGFSNVDDYLYAAQTSAYLHALPDPGSLYDAWRAYGSNTPLVPTLAVPLAAIDESPHVLVLVQALPLLVLVLCVRSLLGSLGLERREAWAGAAATGALAPVLAYAAMYHFGLAAAACAVAAYAAYARSQGLRRTGPAVLTGLALGALALTRVVAPVYVLAVAAPIAVDALTRRPGPDPRAAGAAVLAAVVVAAPWWLAAGGIAWDYLVSAGYEEGTFTTGGSRLEVARERVDHTADETGWLLFAVLVAGLAWAAVRAARTRHTDGGRLLGCLVATCLVGMAALATSSNVGTGFALPFVVLAACLAVVAVAALPRGAGAVAAVLCLAVLAVPLLAMLRVVGETAVAGQPLWREGRPGWAQARAALQCPPCPVPDSDALNREVARAAQGPILIVRADALLNPNGLRHVAGSDVSAPAAPGMIVPGDLVGRAAVVTGTTPAPYLAPHDPAGIAATLRAEGLRPVLRRRLSPANTVEVWAR
jgi:hypothetical protein